MLKVLLARARQGHRTARYPAKPPALPDRFRGVPVIDREKCQKGCEDCARSCPTKAIAIEGGAPVLDLGACIYCDECAQACPQGAISWSAEHHLAARSREDLFLRGPFAERTAEMAAGLKKLFGRSFKLRQVSAGGCAACEADVNVLGTVVFDLGRFGIQMVASPRHADGILVTGPVSTNMRVALQKTYDAIPAPKVVIATGACAISGGPMRGMPEVAGGADKVVPVDLYIPGCPPHPYVILDGLLRLLGRGEKRGQAVQLGTGNVRPMVHGEEQKAPAAASAQKG